MKWTLEVLDYGTGAEKSELIIQVWEQQPDDPSLRRHFECRIPKAQFVGSTNDAPRPAAGWTPDADLPQEVAIGKMVEGVVQAFNPSVDEGVRRLESLLHTALHVLRDRVVGALR